MLDLAQPRGPHGPLPGPSRFSGRHSGGKWPTMQQWRSPAPCAFSRTHLGQRVALRSPALVQPGMQRPLPVSWLTSRCGRRCVWGGGLYVFCVSFFPFFLLFFGEGWEEGGVGYSLPVDCVWGVLAFSPWVFSCRCCFKGGLRLRAFTIRLACLMLMQ